MNIIEFPKLGGLTFNIDPVAFKIGNITVYWYGIIVAAAFLVSVLLAMRQSKNFGINSEDIIDLVLFAAPVGIICARLYYVIFSFESYKYDLTEIFKIWHGGLAIYGAVIGAAIVVVLFAKYKKINALTLLDFGAPYLVLGQAIGRWGNFINQEAFGVNTNLPWGMTGNRIENELFRLSLENPKINPMLPVHPTFLYESLWDLGIFCFLLWFRKRKKLEGEVFSLYLILYGAGRAWIEGLRTDSLMLWNFRVSQVLSILMVIVFIALFIRRRMKLFKLEQENIGVGNSEYAEVLSTLNNDTGINTEENIKENTENNSEDNIEESAEENNETLEDAKRENLEDEENNGISDNDEYAEDTGSDSKESNPDLKNDVAG